MEPVRERGYGMSLSRIRVAGCQPDGVCELSPLSWSEVSCVQRRLLAVLGAPSIALVKSSCDYCQ